MNKRLLTILLASLLVASLTIAYAQTRPRQTTAKPTATTPPAPKPDLLVRRDGTQLEVLVTEITDKEIVYKRVNNSNGPIFRAQKADFSFVKYGSNDEIERFSTVVQQAPAQSPPAQSAPVQTPTSSYPPAPVNRPRQVSQPVAMSEGIHFGLKGGIQSASQSGDYFSGVSVKGILGFHAGLMLDIPLGATAALRPQVLYASKGLKLTNFNNSVSININYIELPTDVLFKIPTSSGKLLLGGGGYFGYALGGSNGYSDLKIGSARTDDLTTTDFGLRASGWYDLSSGLTLNVFYNLGLANLNPTTGDGTYKNRSFGLGIGYFLSK